MSDTRANTVGAQRLENAIYKALLVQAQAEKAAGLSEQDPDHAAARRLAAITESADYRAALHALLPGIPTPTAVGPSAAVPTTAPAPER